MPPRDRNPFETRQSIDDSSYYHDHPTSNSPIPLGATSPRYSPFPAESTENFQTGYGMSAGRTAAYTPMKPKSTRRKWIIIGCIIVAAVAIIGVVVGVVVSRNKNNLSANSGSTNSSSSNSPNSPNSPSNPNDPSNFPKNSAFHQSFYGIAYTPANSQLPNCGNSLAAVIQDIQIMSQLTKRLRLYGADCNQSALVLEAIVQTKVNMTVYLANYPIATDNGTAYLRQRGEIQQALSTYPTDLVAGIIVGNEFMLNYLGDNNISDDDINSAAANVGAAMLVSFIQDTISMLQKMGLSSIPVGNSDAGSYFSNEVLEVVSFGMANVHPWFANVSATIAAAWTAEFFADNDVDLANNLTNKPKMYIAETGWPTGSSTVAAETDGPSVASVANLQIFIDTFVCQANANDTGYFFFEFADEEWKNVTFGGVEGYWGLFNQNLTLKEGLTFPNCPSP